MIYERDSTHQDASIEDVIKSTYDACFEFVDKEISYEGYTPLHLASMNGNLEVVKYLLESYSTLDHIWDYSSTLKTPLQLAVENGHFKVVQCLMDVASFNKDLPLRSS